MFNNEVARENIEYLKGKLTKNLEGLMVKLELKLHKKQIYLLLSDDYDIVVDIREIDIVNL